MSPPPAGWNHKILNVMDRLPKRAHAQARVLLCSIPYEDTRHEAEVGRDTFVIWCRERGYQAAAETLLRDWDRMVCFYAYPQPIWQHIRTTNPVESPFAALRLRTDAAKRNKRVDRATAVMWRLLMVAEQRFRRLNGAQLLSDVYRAPLLVSEEKERRVVEEVAA